MNIAIPWGVLSPTGESPVKGAFSYEKHSPQAHRVRASRPLFYGGSPQPPSAVHGGLAICPTGLLSVGGLSIIFVPGGTFAYL